MVLQTHNLSRFGSDTAADFLHSTGFPLYPSLP